MIRDCIVTYSGGTISLLNPQRADVNITDIAHHLSNICRFTGATSKFYSVAQHCYHVSCHCATPLEGLLHDASEAYIADISTPLKHSKEFKFYIGLEEKHHRNICAAFGINPNFHPSVKEADKRVFCAEVRDIMPQHPEFGKFAKWFKTTTPIAEKIEPWSPEYAESQFLARFNRLRDIPTVKPFKYVLCITNRRQFFDYFIDHNFIDNALVERINRGQATVYLKTGEVLQMAAGPERCMGLDRETTGYIQLYCGSGSDHNGEIDYALKICSRSYRQWTPPIDCKF